MAREKAILTLVKLPSTMATAQTDGFVDNWQAGKSLADCNRHILTSEDSCDVTFRVGKQEKIIRAHSYVLISRSCVFHAMLCGPLAEKDDVKIPDVGETAFRDMLMYLYTENSNLTLDSVTAVLYLAKKYAVPGLESLCLTYLQSALSADNACVILEQAHRFDEKNLYERALSIILNNTEMCLDTPAFADLCKECFDKIVAAANRDMKPEKIFKAAVIWAEAECHRQGREVTPDAKRTVLGKILFEIYFTEMDQKAFVKEIRPFGILTPEECTTILSYYVCQDEDITPFKKKPADSCEMSHLNYNILIAIYEFVKDIMVSPHSIKRYQSINFMCTNDMTICGIQINAKLTATPARCKVRVMNQTRPVSVIEEVCDLEIVDAYLCNAMLSKAVRFHANVSYSIEVDLMAVQRLVGISLKSIISMKNCVVKLSHGEGQVGLIRGLHLAK